MKHGLDPEETALPLLHRDLTEKNMGTAFQVHQHFGFGFLERGTK